MCIYHSVNVFMYLLRAALYQSYLLTMAKGVDPILKECAFQYLYLSNYHKKLKTISEMLVMEFFRGKESLIGEVFLDEILFDLALGV